MAELLLGRRRTCVCCPPDLWLPSADRDREREADRDRERLLLRRDVNASSRSRSRLVLGILACDDDDDEEEEEEEPCRDEECFTGRGGIGGGTKNIPPLII